MKTTDKEFLNKFDADKDDKFSEFEYHHAILTQGLFSILPIKEINASELDFDEDEETYNKIKNYYTVDILNSALIDFPHNDDIKNMIILNVKRYLTIIIIFK